MIRRLAFAAAMLGIAALAGGCGDNNKPKGDPNAAAPKGGPGVAKEPAPAPSPPPK